MSLWQSSHFPITNLFYGKGIVDFDGHLGACPCYIQRLLIMRSMVTWSSGEILPVNIMAVRQNLKK